MALPLPCSRRRVYFGVRRESHFRNGHCAIVARFDLLTSHRAAALIARGLVSCPGVAVIRRPMLQEIAEIQVQHSPVIGLLEPSSRVSACRMLLLAGRLVPESPSPVLMGARCR